MPAPTNPTTEDDDALDVFGAPDPFEAAILAAMAEHKGDDDEDDIGIGPVEIPDEPSRPVYTELEGQRVAADARRAAEEARPTKPAEASKPEDQKAETPDEKAPASGEKASEPATDTAWLAEIPEAHRERVTRIAENAKITEAILPLAVARGIPAAQMPAAVKTLVELNDFANRDLVGYMAHVAGLTGNNTADRAEGLVKALADKLGVKLTPAQADAKKDDPGFDPDEEDEDDAFESPKLKKALAEIAELKQRITVDQNGRARDEQGRFAPQQQAQPAQAEAPPDPAVQERMNAIRTFRDEKAEDGSPLRPHWDSLWQGGYIAAAIQQIKASTGQPEVAATPENLSRIYRDALVLNPATRDEAFRMMEAARATPRPTTGQPPRGRAAAKIIDVGQGAAKPATRVAPDDLDSLLSEAFRDARVA